MVSMQLGKEDERKINKLERARKSWLDANTPPMIVSYFALFHILVKIHTYQMQWKLIWPQKGTDEKIIIGPKKIIKVWVINWYLTRWPSKCKGFVHSLKDLNNHGYNIWIIGFWRSWIQPCLSDNADSEKPGQSSCECEVNCKRWDCWRITWRVHTHVF